MIKELKIILNNLSCKLWITFLSYFLLGLSLAIIHCEYNTLQWFDILAIIIIVCSMFSFASWKGFRIMELN